LSAARTIHEGNFATQNFRNHTHFAAALCEAPKVDDAVGNNLAGRNRSDTRDWHQNSSTPGDFNQKAGGPRGTRFSVRHNNVDDFADSISGRVEDATARQTGYKNSGCAHRITLDARLKVV
jgi:hypothetical protein